MQIQNLPPLSDYHWENPITTEGSKNYITQ